MYHKKNAEKFDVPCVFTKVNQSPSEEKKTKKNKNVCVSPVSTVSTVSKSELDELLVELDLIVENKTKENKNVCVSPVSTMSTVSSISTTTSMIESDEDVKDVVESVDKTCSDIINDLIALRLIVVDINVELDALQEQISKITLPVDYKPLKEIKKVVPVSIPDDDDSDSSDESDSSSSDDEDDIPLVKPIRPKKVEEPKDTPEEVNEMVLWGKVNRVYMYYHGFKDEFECERFHKCEMVSREDKMNIKKGYAAIQPLLSDYDKMKKKYLKGETYVSLDDEGYEKVFSRSSRKTYKALEMVEPLWWLKNVEDKTKVKSTLKRMLNTRVVDECIPGKRLEDEAVVIDLN